MFHSSYGSHPHQSHHPDYYDTHSPPDHAYTPTPTNGQYQYEYEYPHISAVMSPTTDQHQAMTSSAATGYGSGDRQQDLYYQDGYDPSNSETMLNGERYYNDKQQQKKQKRQEQYDVSDYDEYDRRRDSGYARDYEYFDPTAATNEYHDAKRHDVIDERLRTSQSTYSLGGSSKSKRRVKTKQDRRSNGAASKKSDKGHTLPHSLSQEVYTAYPDQYLDE